MRQKKKTLHTVVFSWREKNVKKTLGLTVLLSFGPLTSLLPVHKRSKATLATLKEAFLQLSQAWKTQLAPVYMGHMYIVSKCCKTVVIAVFYHGWTFLSCLSVV